MATILYLLICLDWAPVGPRPVPPLPPINHGNLYKQAVTENKPLVIFVGTPRRDVPETITYETDAFDGDKEPKVLVGVPLFGSLYNVEMIASVSNKGISDTIDVARKEFPSRLGYRLISDDIYQTSDPNVRITSTGRTLRRVQRCDGRQCVMTWE